MMKKFLYLIVLILLCSCGNNEVEQWEYQISPTYGTIDRVGEQRYFPEQQGCYSKESAYQSLYFPEPTVEEKYMNMMGEAGWELAGVFTTIETVYPNFGDDKYHTGIKENTRTQAIYYIYKRRVRK